MKKLLLIAMLALGVVACDRNELGEMDSMSINPIEKSTEISSQRIDMIVEGFLNNLSNFGNSKRGTGNLTGKTGDFIAFHILERDGTTFVILADESNDDFCFGTDVVTTLYFDNSALDGSELSVEQADGTVTLVIKGNWTAVFEGGTNTIFELDADDNDVNSANFNEANLAVIS